MKLPWQNKVWLIDWPWSICSCSKNMTNAWGEVGMGMLVIDWAIKNILGQIMATISFICIIPSINNKRSMLRIRSPMATRTQGDLPVEGPSRHGPMSISMLQHISYNIFCFLLTGVILRNSKEFRFALPFKLSHNNTWFKLNLTDMWAEKLNKFNNNTHQNLHFSNNLLIQMLRNVFWDSTGHQQKYKTIPS